VGATYLVWLVYKLATDAPPHPDAASTAHPMGFWAAAAFQWVNPMAWVMAMTAMRTYLPGDALPLQVLLLAGLFVTINAPCVTCWAAFGSSMRRLLQDHFRLRVVNMSMAAALVASLYPLLKP
jgi:threonine/homoserine/homoserine lactone efflux protein